MLNFILKITLIFYLWEHWSSFLISTLPPKWNVLLLFPNVLSELRGVSTIRDALLLFLQMGGPAFWQGTLLKTTTVHLTSARPSALKKEERKKILNKQDSGSACGSCYFELARPIFTHWQATGKNSWRCREFSLGGGGEGGRLHCESGAKQACMYIQVSVRSARGHTYWLWRTVRQS